MTVIVLAPQVVSIPAPQLPPEIGSIMVFQEIVLPLVGIAFGGLVLWGVYRTVNRYLERRHGGAELEAMRADVELLRGKAERAEDLALRLGEVEERLDFAERLLTQQKQGRLGQGT